MDISEDMKNLAARINRVMVEQGKADFRCGDAGKLDWPDKSFTAAASIESFFFWPDPEAGLKEVCRVLKPGGRFVIAITANKDDKRDFTKLAAKTGFFLYSGDDIIRMSKEAGFSECSITRRSISGMVNAVIAKAVK